MTRFEFLMKVEQYKNGEITEMDMVAAAEAWEKALIAAKPIVSRSAPTILDKVEVKCRYDNGIIIIDLSA
jgi:hypothetical protein